MKKAIGYTPEKCECCGQTKTYLLAIDRGSVDIVKAVARAIEEKGTNCVHVNKELVGRYITPLQMTNMTRPRSHGLIAHVRGKKGNYLLTRKGARFLHGDRIPRYAIVSKELGKQIGYFKEEEETVSIHDFSNNGEYWEGIGYEIVEGDVIRQKAPAAPSLFDITEVSDLPRAPRSPRYETRDNFEGLQNEGHERVREDFGDAPTADRTEQLEEEN